MADIGRTQGIKTETEGDLHKRLLNASRGKGALGLRLQKGGRSPPRENPRGSGRQERRGPTIILGERKHLVYSRSEDKASEDHS